MTTLVQSIEGDTLDRIAWEHYGERPGALEAVFEANPHAVGLGLVLPVGTAVTLPELEERADARISIWD